MGVASSLAAYGAASSAFVACRDVVSFLPSVVTPLVAKAYGAGGKEAALKPVREAFLIAVVVGIIATVLLVLDHCRLSRRAAGGRAQFLPQRWHAGDMERGTSRYS